MKAIKIGTRGSALALWQANHVAARLRERPGGPDVELVVIKTKGDRIQDVPLAKVGGKGLFVTEIEESLRRGDVDLAVHSMKDVPADLVSGLTLAAIPERGDPRDVLVSVGGAPLDELPAGARVGTSSLRRRSQVLALRPDLKILDLRGNVDTRLRKLDDGLYDAVILAAAGLRRLGYEGRITELLSPERMIPAAGQGALGIETRADDAAVNAMLTTLHHGPTALRVRAERALLGRLGGGCQVPVAAHATLNDGRIELDALVGHPGGQPIFREHGAGPADAPDALGLAVGGRLLKRGADRILKEVYGEL